MWVFYMYCFYIQEFFYRFKTIQDKCNVIVKPLPVLIGLLSLPDFSGVVFVEKVYPVTKTVLFLVVWYLRRRINIFPVRVCGTVPTKYGVTTGNYYLPDLILRLYFKSDFIYTHLSEDYIFPEGSLIHTFPVVTAVPCTTYTMTKNHD